MQLLDWHLNANFPESAIIAALGHIPEFVFAQDPRPIWEQIDARYIGGWQAMAPGKWILGLDDYLLYPGNPALPPLATAYHGQERIIVYPHAWACIVQPDGQFSVARLD